MRLRIKDIIKEKGTTMSEVAEKIGTKQAALSRAISEGGNPTLSLLQRTADALNVPITELFITDSPNELTALIDHHGQLYRANSIEELEEIIQKIKAG